MQSRGVVQSDYIACYQWIMYYYVNLINKCECMLKLCERG